MRSRTAGATGATGANRTKGAGPTPDDDELIVVNRALLPLNKLRDYVPTAVTAKGAQEQKLAAALEDLSLASRETSAHKSKLEAALAKKEEEAELAKRKQVRVSLFEKFLTGDEHPDQAKAALHLIEFLGSKDLVHMMITSMRLVRFANLLQFKISLRVAEVVRLGKTAYVSNTHDRGKRKGKPGSFSEGSFPVTLGILRECHLFIGGHAPLRAHPRISDASVDQGGEVVGIDGIKYLCAFLTNTANNTCIVDSFAIQVDSTVNDISIQSFIKLLAKPLLSRLQNLSLEGCTMGIPGLQILSDTLKKKCLPVLSSLNVSRTYAQHLGIHKLSSAIATGCCPFLSTLRISSNYARAAVFEFFEASFASKTKFLMSLEAQDNDCDLMDPDIISILNKGTSTWRNWISLDLSFNPLGDTLLCNKLLKQVWPLVPNVYAENFHSGLGTMEVLSLQGCNVGINSVSYLSELWMQTPAEKNALVSLNLGMNDLDLLALRRLIEPINARKLGSLRELSIPLNLIEPEGIIILSNACTLGSLDSLVHLDISDVGGNSECILVLARALVLRWQNKQLCLRRLKILGRAPFAGRNARVIFGKEFMDEVSVS